MRIGVIDIGTNSTLLLKAGRFRVLRPFSVNLSLSSSLLTTPFSSSSPTTSPKPSKLLCRLALALSPE